MKPEQLLPGVLIHRTVSWLPADAAIAAAEDWDYTPDLDELLDPTPRKRLPFPDWHAQAACATADEETFFGARDTTERPALSMSDVALAKAICAECPVYRTCLETALGLRGENREEYGIWAGTSGRTRKRIWALVDNEGRDLREIADDILAGNLADYERSAVATPLEGQILPFPGRVPAQEEAA